MPRPTSDELPHLIRRARGLLGLTQAEFAVVVDTSHRSAGRWERGEASPTDLQLAQMARFVYPHDRALAAQIARHAGDTLQSLGIETPATATAVTRGPLPASDLADIVLCAASEARGGSPAELRPVLHAAFRRARELALTVGEVEDAFAARLGLTEAREPAPGKKRSEAKGKAGPASA